MKKGVLILFPVFFFIFSGMGLNEKYTVDKPGEAVPEQSVPAGCPDKTGEPPVFCPPDDFEPGLKEDSFPRVSCPGQSGKEDHEIIIHDGFSLCYRESYEQAEWVAYIITADKLEKNAERTNDFREDFLVSTGSASPGDYKYSGYDRGHLAPAADMAYSTETMSQSFLMSNMSPQAPGFNRGIWKNLEAQVRTWAEKYNPLYVVTGPVLEEKVYPVIGENQVVVPEYYYKVLYTPETPEGKPAMAAFIIPNESVKAPVSSFLVTVDEVEEKTGLDFFWDLEDVVENSLESEMALNPWF